MPQLTDLHVDQALTNISIQFRPAGFVADQIFPIVPVVHESDKYYKYTLRNLFQQVDPIRAPKSNARKIDWNIETDGYVAIEYALMDLIDDRERANADPALDLDIDTTEAVTLLLKLAYEKRILDSVTDTAKLTQNTTLSGTSQWSDYANSNPINDVYGARTTIHQNTGLNPNVLVLGRPVYDKLVHHSDLIERIKYVQKGITSADIMASLFGVDEVMVSEAQADVSNEGQMESLSYLMGKNALLFYRPPRPSLRTPALGYTFQPRSMLVRRYRDERAHSDAIEVSHIVAEKLVSASVGYLFKNAVA